MILPIDAHCIHVGLNAHVCYKKAALVTSGSFWKIGSQIFLPKDFVPEGKFLGKKSVLETTINPNPLGILHVHVARNLPESSKIHQCTFGNMPSSSKCTMHFR